MREKTITVVIDGQGTSTLDLEGFIGQECEKAFEDFRGGDAVKLERKKSAYYAAPQAKEQKSQR
jgi:hypothetical protein